MQLEVERSGKQKFNAVQKPLDRLRGKKQMQGGNYYGKRNKYCWNSTLHTNTMIFYYYQCNKLEIKLLKKSVVITENKGKTASVNQTILEQNQSMTKK